MPGEKPADRACEACGKVLPGVRFDRGLGKDLCNGCWARIPIPPPPPDPGRWRRKRGA